MPKIKKPGPFFSIVIPTLNEEKYLPDLLGDLIRQTYRNFEVIVVDGGSKDGTIEEVLIFQKKLSGLKIIISKIADLSIQRNLGAQKASGEWILFCDADNQLTKSFLFDLKKEILKYPHLALWGCGFEPDIDSLGNRLIAFFVNSGMFFLFALKRPVQTALIGVKKKIFERTNGFKPDTFAEDLDFSLRIGKMGFRSKFLVKPKYIYSFRRFRSRGFLAVVIKSTVLNFKNLLRIPYDLKREYPMGGE